MHSLSLSSELCRNVSTTPITAMGCRQCLPLSVVQLKGKHCRKPHCHNRVVSRYVRALNHFSVTCLPQSAWSIKMDAQVSIKTKTMPVQNFFRYISFQFGPQNCHIWRTLFLSSCKYIYHCIGADSILLTLLIVQNVYPRPTQGLNNFTRNAYSNDLNLFHCVCLLLIW